MGTMTFQQWKDTRREVPNVASTMGFEPGESKGFTAHGPGYVYADASSIEIDRKSRWGEHYRVTLGHETHITHDLLTLERLLFQHLVSNGAIETVAELHTACPDVAVVRAYLCDGDLIQSAISASVSLSRTHYAQLGNAAFWKDVTGWVTDALLDKGYEGDHNALFAVMVHVARYVRHHSGSDKLPDWIRAHTEIEALIASY